MNLVRIWPHAQSCSYCPCICFTLWILISYILRWENKWTSEPRSYQRGVLCNGMYIQLLNIYKLKITVIVLCISTSRVLNWRGSVNESLPNWA